MHGPKFYGLGLQIPLSRGFVERGLVVMGVMVEVVLKRVICTGGVVVVVEAVLERVLCRGVVERW